MRSAGQMSPVWAELAKPVRRRLSRNWSALSSTFRPGIAENLSTVPPVWPRPRPLNMAQGTPQAATMGPRIRVVLSPTPPVLCLSTLTPGTEERSIRAPESRMPRVRARVSSVLMPRQQMAMSRAALCSSGIVPSVTPFTQKAICSGVSAPPVFLV